MNFKIIETSPKLPDVLLYRDRDNIDESVKILAIGVIDSFTDMFVTEEIMFENSESAINFIKDYSVESANKWCNKQKIEYA